MAVVEGTRHSVSMGRKYLDVFFLVADGKGTNVWCWYGMVIGFWDNNFYFYGFFKSFFCQIFVIFYRLGLSIMGMGDEFGV